VRDVAPHRQRVPPAVGDLTSDTSDSALGPRADGYRGTGIAQGQGNGAADPPARPGDQRDLPVHANRRRVLP
jgi:hypothetical protein